MVKLGGFAQTRLTYARLEGVDDDLNFSVPRARLGLKGHAFSEDLSYKVLIEFGKGFTSLKDAYLDYKMHNWVHLRAGQFKKPFSRHLLTSATKLAMVDRAPTDKPFGPGRDIGVMVHNNGGKSSKIEYAVGVFNGSGAKSQFSGTADEEGNVSGKLSNVPGQMEPVLVARVGYNHGGINGYSEVDFEGGGFRAALGASAQMWLDADDDDNGAAAASVDLMLKMKGATVSGAFSSKWSQRVAADENTSWTDQEHGAKGFHAQASYLIKDKYAPVVRYSKMMNVGADNDAQEIAGGLGFYPYKHRVKVQADGGAAMTQQAGGESTTDYFVRVQSQFVF